MNTPHMKKTLLVLGLIASGTLGAIYLGNNSNQNSQGHTPSASLINTAHAAPSGHEKMGVHPLGEQTLGKKDAPVVMVEYASFTCPHCGAFHNNVYPQIKKELIDTGKVRFIYRDYPLDNTSLAISMLARCIARDVGNDKFFPLIKVLFERQKGWMSAKNVKAEIVKITKLAGYGESKFDSCLADKAIESGVREVQTAAGQKLGVRGTPTLFINGEMYRGGNSFEAISKKVNSLIKK